MKKYFLFSLLGIAFSFAVIAEELFQSQGFVSEQSADASRVVINYQQYHIDHKTIIHGMVRQGERGPVLNKEQEIGFNVEQNFGETPRISEIWFLPQR